MIVPVRINGFRPRRESFQKRSQRPPLKELCLVARFLVIFWPIVGLGLLLLPTNVAAANSPLTLIRTTVEEVIAVLQDPTYQRSDRRQERFAKIRAIVLPRFDSQALAQRALGRYWQARTENERQEFIPLFTDLVEKSYRRTLDRYTSDLQVVYDQERIENGFAEVDTRLLSAQQSEPLGITYRLHKVKDQWLIYDMVIANVSMIRNYRSQFDRILSRSSYAELLETIRQKLQELDVSSPPSR